MSLCATTLCAALAALAAERMTEPGAGWAEDAEGSPISSLSANTLQLDADGDGLVDSQELLVGTSPLDFDSDADGFGDGEEFARHSDPRDPLSLPEGEEVSATLLARGQGGKLRLVVALHEPQGLSDVSMLRIGALAQGEIVSVPLARFLGIADVRGVGGSANSSVTTIDLPIDPNFVHASGGMVTFFLAAGQTDTMTFNTAAKVDIRSEAGELVMLRPIQSTLDRRLSGGNGAGLREPIPVSTPPPPSAGWVSGAICYQRSEVVGINGPRILHQIVEADCLEGWDSYCSGECAASVGATYETVDPLALIGG
ncbi:MAG: hypothetical protein VXW31_08540 [Planctomycetota bacterium]|nr:hypothetical protein [Planctomycetota bacterium]